MRFINLGEPIKIRKGDLINFSWITLKKGETIDLPENIGKNNGLKELKTTKGQIGNVKVETKQIEVPEKIKISEPEYTPDDLFFKELTKINGIGPKMANDIVVWGTKEKLIENISLNAELPFRDDIVKLLEKRYG